MRLSVRAYIPNPLRCFQCQRFGHSKTSCRGTQTCARCAEVGHDSSQCTDAEKCVNCKDAHTSFSRNCSAWKLEKAEEGSKIPRGNSDNLFPDISFPIIVQSMRILICEASSRVRWYETNNIRDYCLITERETI
ncbi:hypothetical protein AVEN_246262-1 [Araneus ventricosus]|nr:hypothetical protein AVEN_246262-1 [Araneus ventricosus]